MRRAGFVLLAVLGVLAGLAVVVAVRTARLAPEPVEVRPADPIEIDRDAAVARLAAAIRIPTVSTDEGPAPPDTLARLHRFLEAAFPRVHAALAREVVGGGSLLYVWEGADSRAAPILLLAHLDVVPVEPGTEGRWTHPPFSGAIAGGRVWGRGAMDDKASALAILEAVEALLAAGFQPRRGVLVALGHDEERGGAEGAARMAAFLQAREVRPAFVLDEGYAVLEELVPGIEAPVALVGVAEKGFVNVELVARGEGGHSSMPPRETAVTVLARAILRVAEERPPARLDGLAERTFTALAPHMEFGHRALFANLWLFRPVVRRAMAREHRTDALLRTTTAPTMLEGSPKANVLPSEARAVVNFRIRPGDTTEGIVDHVRRAADDPRVDVRTVPGFASEPSPVSPDSGAAWELLAVTIRQTVGTEVVAPALVVGGTDARHYVDLAEAVYRFVPLRVTGADVDKIHGTDESVGVDDYARMIRFYAQLVRNAQAGLP